jgi:glutathione S-transferase
VQDDRLFLTGNRLTIADFSVSASISMLELNDWQFSRWVKVDEWRKRMQELAYYEEVNKPLDEFKQKIRAQQHDE